MVNYSGSKPRDEGIFMKLCMAMLLLLVSVSTYSQNLLHERIRKVPPQKSAKYFENGIFHNGMVKVNSKIVGLRHSFKTADKEERIVFDFSTANIPRVYGYFSKDKKLLTIDFIGADINDKIGSFGKSSYVKDVNFFPVKKDSVSAEIHLKESVKMDMFYLENPGRLVIDLKM